MKRDQCVKCSLSIFGKFKTSEFSVNNSEFALGDQCIATQT